MAYLVNRNPGARFQCLHSICKFINSEFGRSTSFKLSDIKFGARRSNIHSFCNYLAIKPNLGIQHCRYKAALDQSGCSLTNSVNVDSTKSKEVSNTVNCLHGLGLVTRDSAGYVKLTKLGEDFAKTDFLSENLHPILVKAVLNYGPMIGLLGQIIQKNSSEFDTSELTVGYPVTEEKIIYKGRRVTISSGSEQDSNTRTRSCLIAWGISAGFFKPVNLPMYKATRAHISSEAYILSETRNQRKYEVLKLPNLTQVDFLTQRTLDYINLTKSSKALRENNQAEVREATMQSSSIIRNRRFAILHLLNYFYHKRKSISLDSIIAFLEASPELYVLNSSELKRVISIEIEIANSAGIILGVHGHMYSPQSGINVEELNSSAPISVLNDIEKRLK